MPNIVITVYLKEHNGHYAKYKEDITKYNAIARTALKDALDTDTTIVEENLMDVAEDKEDTKTEGILEEVPVEKKGIFGFLRKKD